mgnify:CR=1 FL=1
MLKKNIHKMLSFLVMASFLFSIGAFLLNPEPIMNNGEDLTSETVLYADFLGMVEEDNVSEVTIDLDSSIFVFKLKDNEEKIYITDNPKKETFKEFLLLNKIKVTDITNSSLNKGIKESKNSVIGGLVSFLVNLLIIVVIFFVIGGFLSKGLFKNRIVQEVDYQKSTKIPDVTFEDVQGCTELKRDIQNIISFLKNPSKYTNMGARMPKGIVLYGPPGTGKTLTAKAIAGTAGVPFFSVSGSDFIEMYVGVGAKRVRELYSQAKKNSPCIVFIDEIDAVGGLRGVNNNSERDQTINALLHELDGFNGSEGIITICATNRLELLDPALIRPGRFDKHVAVPLPEKDDRLAILKIHAKNKKFAEDVDLSEIASMTVGFSGADLEALLNESAFIAVSNSNELITNEDLDRAFFKQVMKGDKKENQSSRDRKELELVAYHEAGHALATKLLTDEEVPKVTIISSTSGAGGVTFRTPRDSHLYSKSYLKNLIKVLYAGRGAEYIFLKNNEDITVGASNDIKQASNLIKEYITTYGLNDNIGMLNLSVFSSGNELNQKIIEEASCMAKELYDETINLLKENKDKLELIATNLFEKETLNNYELDELLSK